MNPAVEWVRCMQLIEDCCKAMKVDVPINLEWSTRMTTTLGRAWYFKATNTGRIRLNQRLWERAPLEQRDETVIHEAAHIIARIKSGKMDHGPNWRWVMSCLGYPNANRCHDVDTSGLKRRQKRIVILCPGCETDLRITKNLKTRWVKNQQTRICNKCRARLPYTLLI